MRSTATRSPRAVTALTPKQRRQRLKTLARPTTPPTFVISASAHLGPVYIPEARALVNLALVGKEACNRESPSGEIVAAYPDALEAPLQAAHHLVSTGYGIPLGVWLDATTGRLTFRVLPPYSVDVPTSPPLTSRPSRSSRASTRHRK